MGRQVKTGLDYFPFETKFFTDIKVRKLIKYQGGKSALIYACLLCSIYENGYYMLWDNEIPFLVSEKTGFEEGYINEVIKCCFNVGLFDKNLYEKSNVITSKGIQERYDAISKLLKRKHQITEFSLISSEEKGIYSEEIMINLEETHINSGLSAQKKRKESKVKEIKINTPIPPSQNNIEDLFQEGEKKPDDMVDSDARERKKVAEKKESEIVDYFHDKCKRLPKVQVISDSRKKSINARLNDHGLQKILDVIDLVGQSNFLAGENNKQWTADFDWIFKPTNFIKIMEGNYKNKEYKVNTVNNGSSQARRR